MASSKTGLGYIEEGQQGNDVTFSENMNRLDGMVQISVINQITSAPPTPANGHAYIVASGGTGSFAGKDGKYAYYQDQWYFFTPQEGWLLYDKADTNFYFYSATSTWELFSGGGGGTSDFLSLTNKNYSHCTSGVISGLEITINSGDNSLFDVAAGVGLVLDYTVEATPTWTRVIFAGLTGVTVTNLATADFSRIYLQTNGSLRQVANFQGGPEDRRGYIQLQVIIHADNLTISSVTSDSFPAYNNVQDLVDMIVYDGPYTEGLFYTPAVAGNLKIDRAAGKYLQLHCNRRENNLSPNTKEFLVDTNTSFLYNQMDGVGGFEYIGTFVSDINPDIYDDGTGVTGTVPAGFWTIQRVWFFGQSDTNAMALGQNTYSSYEDALANILTESYEQFPEFEFAQNTTRIIVRQGATDLTDLTQCVFIDFDKNTALLPGTSTLELQRLVQNMKFTGLQEWGGTGTYYTIVGGNTLQVDRPGVGWILGHQITWLGGQAAVALTQYYTTYVYIDSDGVVNSKTDVTSLDYENSIMLFEAYYDGGVVVVRDDHPVSVPSCTASFLHSVIGTVLGATGAVIDRVSTGSGGVAGDREIKIVGAGVIYDHGISDAIPDSAGAGITWNTYYTNASSQYVLYNTQTELNMYYNNAGTPTLGGTASNTGYIINTLYVSKSDRNSSTPKYFAIMDNAQYSSLALAEAAINDGVFQQVNGQLAKLELVQLGYVILKNNVTSGYVAEVQVSKTVLNAQAIAQQGNTAAQISTDTSSFDGLLSETDSPVQSALETIDEFGKSSSFEVKDATDLTKLFNLNLASIPTGTATTMTIGDKPISFVNSTENYVLTWTAAGGWAAAAAPGAGGGETNTASNTGTVGVGLFKQKTDFDLQFYKINSTNSAITFALNGTDRADLTFVPGNVSHSALGGLTNHVADGPGTPGTTTQYVYQITAAGAKSWQEYVAGGGGGGLTTEVKTTDFTIASGKRYIVDNASIIVATLPASWSVGDEFVIISIQSDVEIKSGAISQKMYQAPDESLTSTGANELLMTTLANRSSHWVADTTLRFYEMEQAERASVAVITTGKGYALGGNDGANLDRIEGLVFASDSGFTSSATLSAARTAIGGANSLVDGYSFGTGTEIDGFTFSTDTSKNPAAALSVGRTAITGVQSDLKGYAMGGWSESAVIDGIIFLSQGGFTSSATLADAAGYTGGSESDLKGYMYGGFAVTAGIQGITFIADTSFTSTATLSDSRRWTAGVKSTTKGYAIGGYDTGAKTVIDGLIFTTDTAFTSLASLTTATRDGAGSSSATKGYILGGFTNTRISTIQGVIFEIDAFFTSSATLSSATDGLSGAGVESPDTPPETTTYGADYSTTDISEFTGTILTAAESTVQKALVKVDSEILGLKTQTLDGLIETVSNKTYIIKLKMSTSGTVEETTTKSISGTCTATFNINGVALGGTENSVSSTETDQAHVSANTFVEGDTLNIVVTNNSACLDFAWTITYTN